MGSVPFILCAESVESITQNQNVHSHAVPIETTNEPKTAENRFMILAPYVCGRRCTIAVHARRPWAEASPWTLPEASRIPSGLIARRPWPGTL